LVEVNAILDSARAGFKSGVDQVMRTTRHGVSVISLIERSAVRGGGRLLRRLFSASILAGGIIAPAHAAPEIAICAVEQAIACPPFAPCERNLPGAVNLPALLKIDRPAGVILSRREAGDERSSKIESESGDENSHVLQGVDDGNPWSIRIDLNTGRFSLSSAQPDTGYIAFGLCSANILK
jgi:hypothetical protein